MDEFSSKTVCVTTQKMKILDKFLDEFYTNKGISIGCNSDTKKVNWLWSIYNDRTVYRRLIRLFYRNPILGALLFNLFYCIGEVIRVLIG